MRLDQVSSYEDAVSYIEMIPRFLAKNNKEMTDAFYRYLHDTAKSPIAIHVAGTNGKGSVCSFLKCIGVEMGKTVGVFTSPHLVTTTERIVIADENGDHLITEEDFLEVFHMLSGKVTDFQQTKLEYAQYHPSYFEFLFFMAVLYFDRHDLDMIIWETGLGGRLDATNSIVKKDACVITEIGLDHCEYLGDTFSEIAGEKAGIIRENVPVIYCKKRPDVSRVIEERVAFVKAPVFAVSNEDVIPQAITDKYIDFSYKSRYYEYIGLRINGRAKYQMENASLALRCAEVLFSQNELSKFAMTRAISHMKWAGRMEEIADGVWFDGAHNEDGIRAFIESVQNDSCKGERVLLFSAVSDKRFVEMTRMLKDSKLFSKVYIARLHSSRGISLEELNALFADFPDVHVCEDVIEAFEKAIANKRKNDYIYVAGSLYLVGELKGYLEKKRGLV